MSANRVFFPNLNSLRFLAAVAVIIHHVEMAKHWFGLPNIYSNSFVGGTFGEVSIIMFFVLSGFLITYLLLEEHARTGTISIRSFYARRILRIWPVYYLVVIFSLFILPNFHWLDLPGFSEHLNEGFAIKCITYLSFLPNLGYVMYEHIPYATQTWSVGVEEQFYLLWPVLMLFAINRKKTIHVLVGTVIFYLAIKVITVVNYAANPVPGATEKIWLFWDHFSIDCMAMGGISAYLLYYKKEKVLNILFNKYLQIALYIILGLIIVKGLMLPWFSKEVFALIFMVLILNFAGNKNTVLNFEYRWLSYLGKVTYGMYMYHNLVLTVILKLFLVYDWLDVSSISGGIVYHAISLALTIGLSVISYEYFEKWFLGVKTRFARVQSGDEVSTPVPVANAPEIPVPAQPRTA